MWFILLVIGFSVLADFSLLKDTFDMTFQAGFWITCMVPLALLASYLALGYIAGCKVREFKAFKRIPALVTSILLSLLELCVLAAIFVVRCYGEVQKQGGMGSKGIGLSFSGEAAAESSSFSIGKAASSGQGIFDFFDKVSELGVDVIFPAVALSLIMLIGACLDMYYAYCKNDPYAAEKKLIAQTHIAEDKQLYENTFLKALSSFEKHLTYEEQERALDKRALKSSFKINKLITQLNSIVDPADVYDFTSIRNMLLNSSRQ